MSLPPPLPRTPPRMKRTAAAASRSRPWELSQRGDSGRPKQRNPESCKSAGAAATPRLTRHLALPVSSASVAMFTTQATSWPNTMEKV